MKRLLSLLLVLYLVCSAFACPVYAANGNSGAGAGTAAADPLVAFPGAEGGGKYSKGARGALDSGEKIEVYHVTNLDPDGEGSFKDAVRRGNRIIVFDVGGIIRANGTIEVKKDNVTILGQTAPGDGITLTGGNLQFANAIGNVILRYFRVRPTDDSGDEVDALGGRWNHDIIIDHCSASWSIDECLTLYAGTADQTDKKHGNRLTVQNTISSESMRMSNHFKGAHGYGAIIGGDNSTYWRNLFAHHDSRSPRFDRVLNKTDFRNNVIYNWGVTNSAYGGEPTSPHNSVISPTLLNYADNYCKFGPSTVSGKRYRIYDFSGLAKQVGQTYHDAWTDTDKLVDKSKFYLADNFVFGNTAITADNWSSTGVNAPDQVEKAKEPFSLGDDLYPDLNIPADKLLSGEVTLSILDDVGATLPRRDSIDARVIADVRNQTGRVINRDEEVGDFTGIEESHREFVIPDDWKATNNMGVSQETDIVPDGKWKGYTWIEAYVNDWTEQQSASAPTNPDITVESPAIAAMNGKNNKSNWTVIKDTDTLNYKAQATPVGDTAITKMQLCDGENILKTYDGASAIDDSITLEAGTHYLSCLAYNDKGESTRSTTSIVYVNGSNAPEGWTHKQIGSTSYSGKGFVSSDQNGSYLMGGSGKIGAKADKCDFMYKEVSGDFDISLKMDEIPKNENGAVFGLMVRETLDANSRMASLVDGWIKYGRNNRIVARTVKGANIAVDSEQTNDNDRKIGIFMTGRDGEIVSGNVLGEHPYATLPDEKYHLPNYLRIQRSGDRLVFSVSDSGTDWKDNSRQPYSMEISGLAEKLYVGVAIDSQQGQSDASPQLYYSQARFSELKLDNKSNIEDEVPPTPTPTVNPDKAEEYKLWKYGSSTEAGDVGSGEVLYYEGRDALNVQNFNVYQELSEPVSTGIVSFDLDVYVDKYVDRSFRIYLENTAGGWQNNENVFAEIINNRNKQVNKGPGIDVQNDPLFTYSQLSKSGWVHISALIDYDKAETDEFITLTATDNNGAVIGRTHMPGIEGRDKTLKSIRLVKTANPAYFSNMNIIKSDSAVSDKAVYAAAPSVSGNSVTATVKNIADKDGVVFIAAAYENGMTAEVLTDIVENGQEKAISLTFSKEYDDIRFYLWSSGTLEPYSYVHYAENN